MPYYILNCTATPNYQLPTETVNAAALLGVEACKNGFTEKASAAQIFAACKTAGNIKESLVQEPKYWTINGEENEQHFIDAALRQIFANSGMAFGHGVVIVDTSTRIGRLLEIALKNKGVKTLKKKLTYSEVKRLHSLKDEDFAAAFGLKSKSAFANSSALERYKAAVERIYLLFSDCR